MEKQFKAIYIGRKAVMQYPQLAPAQWDKFKPNSIVTFQEGTIWTSYRVWRRDFKRNKIHLIRLDHDTP